jgi:hypothetical protein
MNEWNIQSRAHACQACGKSFADKEVYHTLLTTHKHELQRQDICQSCWNAENAKLAGPAVNSKSFVSQWHALYHAPQAAAVEPIQKESAETLLRKLIEANDPKHGPACYILAVMLERKRLLKIKEQFRRDGARVFVYDHPKSGDVFTITDPNLQLNQLDEVQRDVSDLLAHGLPETAPIAQTTPAEADADGTSREDASPVNAQAPAQPETPATDVSSAPSTAAEAAGEAAAAGAASSEDASVMNAPTAAPPETTAEISETTLIHEPGTSDQSSNQPAD